MYNARQTTLKWVLVTSFGYLGFNNAKFGRIDAHIAVCAFDRQILIRTIRTAEQQGFKILHAIVDSIWVQKKDGQKNARAEDYEALEQAIETKLILIYHLKAFTSGLRLFLQKVMILLVFPIGTSESLKMGHSNFEELKQEDMTLQYFSSITNS